MKESTTLYSQDDCDLMRRFFSFSYFFALLLLFSLVGVSHGSFLWQTNLYGSCFAQPLIYSGTTTPYLLIHTQKDEFTSSILFVSLNSGEIASYNTDLKNHLISGLIISGNKIYAYDASNVYRLTISSGELTLSPLKFKKPPSKELFVKNKTHISIYSGVGDHQGGAFFLTSDGLYYFNDKSTLATHISNFECSFGSSLLLVKRPQTDELFFTCDHDLKVMSVFEGSAKLVDQARAPLLPARVHMVYDPNSSLLFVPGYDGHLYAYRLPKKEGAPIPVAWTFTTSAPISTTPLIYIGNVYFCSGDYAYAVSESNGKLVWKQKIYGESQAPNMAKTRFNGKAAVIASSSNGEIFIFDAANGEPLFSFNVQSAVAGFTLYQNRIYYTLVDGHVGAYDLTDYGCSVPTSVQDLKVGYKVVNISGTYFTSATNPSIEICIVPYSSTCGPSNWVAVTKAEDGHWNYVMNPMKYPFGALRVECRIEDSAHTTPAVSAPVMIMRDKNLPRNKLMLSYPLFAQSGSTVSIKVTDERGDQVGSAYIFVNGKKYKVSKDDTIKVKLTPLFGVVQLSAKKQWYDGDHGMIIVYPPFTYVCGSVLLILFVIVLIVVYVMRRRMQSLM